jgi:hypothetical protein
MNRIVCSVSKPLESIPQAALLDKTNGILRHRQERRKYSKIPADDRFAWNRLPGRISLP